MAGRYRPRRELKFWLFLDKPEESRLIEFIEYCKAKRSFARVVRDGIRLMWSLGEGDTSVLFDLFPGLRTQLTPVQPPPDTGKLERQIADLKKLILEQGTIIPPPADYPQMKSSGTLGIGKKMTLPILDDEDENATLIISKPNKGNNGGNLLDSMFSL